MSQLNSDGQITTSELLLIVEQQNQQVDQLRSELATTNELIATQAEILNNLQNLVEKTAVRSQLVILERAVIEHFTL